ncbi:serine hydrolase domain-containing protein [Streptomyces sp. NPDC101118]|uniref:serine hydrolase domain-containing protein n=1 Tax=Streptomyces sp. NPDC101118 TaxID=3366109 RepID=UPI00380DBBC1
MTEAVNENVQGSVRGAGDGVHGQVAPGWEPVRDELAAFVAGERHSPEAQLVLHHGGRRVVDLWTGEDTGPDTLGTVYSITKGAAHLVVALLVQEGRIDLDRPVSGYWPEFTGRGLERLTVRELLAHRSGLIGVEGGFTYDELTDDAALAARVVRAEPYWEPGTKYGYHAMTIGALTGEMVRRVTGRTVAEEYEERVRVPYGLDFYIGLPEELEERWAPILPMLPTDEQLAARAALGGPGELQLVAFNWNTEPRLDMVDFANDRRVRAGGPASSGGVGTARGIAGMYAAALELLEPETATVCARLTTPGADAVVPQEDAFGLGFERQPTVGDRAFGHSGAAGANAFADPATGLAYAYTRRRFAFPGGAAPENDRFARVAVEVAGRLG